MMERPEITVTYYGESAAYEVMAYESNGPEGSLIIGRQRLAGERGELFYCVHRSMRLAANKVRITLDGELSWLYFGAVHEQMSLANLYTGQSGPLLCTPLGSALMVLRREQYDMMMRAEEVAITATWLDGFETEVLLDRRKWHFVRGRMYLMKSQLD